MGNDKQTSAVWSANIKLGFWYQLGKFMKEECQNLKLIPQQGISEPAEDGYTQIKVTGKVQTPWFGGNVGMDIAWRFLLNPENKIFFVAIDLLASPKELLNFIR
ncbi:MAG: hypothetical protein Kow0091_17330 [Geminocystis sp.]